MITLCEGLSGSFEGRYWCKCAYISVIVMRKSHKIDFIDL
jgi:hypothetical protein